MPEIVVSERITSAPAHNGAEFGMEIVSVSAPWSALAVLALVAILLIALFVLLLAVLFPKKDERGN